MTTADISLWRRLRYTRLADLARGHWDASLDWRIVLAAADLPPELAELVAGVVRHTRLWRRERVDVARELIAHFRDGLDAGRTPRELAQSFGDPRQVARLIGRAKRRGRPLAWYVWLYGLWTIWAVLLLYAIAAVWLVLSKPVPSTDYLTPLNAVAHDVAPDQRAWPVYRDALESLGYHQDQPSSGQPFRPFGVNQDARPGDADWPALETFLTEHQPALAELRRAAAKSHLGYEIGFGTRPSDRALFGEIHADETHAGEAHPPLIGALLLQLQPMRSAAQLLAADVARAADAGDPLTAHQDVVAILGMSRQAGETPFLVGGLVGMVIEQQACDAIQRVLTVRPQLWSGEQLVELAHRLGSLSHDPSRSLEDERIAMHDIVQRIYTDDGHGDGTVTYSGLKELLDQTEFPDLTDWTQKQSTQRDRLLAAGMPIVASVMASRAELEDEYDRLFAMAVVDLQTPLWKEHRTVEDEVHRLDQSTWSRYEYAPILIMMPAVNVVHTRAESARGRAEGVMIGLALELYHRENGRWPASLNELSPRWLPAVPDDRINGGPLGYRIIDNRPLVYSLGNDGDDDHGLRPESQLREDCTGGICPYEIRIPDPCRESGDWVVWSTVSERGAAGE